MKTDVVQQVEEYVKHVTGKSIAHDFKHFDCVRNWALLIAEREGFNDLEVVEVTALLHDIGLPYLKENENRGVHGERGAEIAGKYLRENKLLPEEKIQGITNAIRYHSRKRYSSGKLLDILCDADTLDALGAVGIIRAFTSKYFKAEYSPENIKGDNWGLSCEEYEKLYKRGREAGDTIIDQINLQVNHSQSLTTETAKQLAEPLLKYMKDFIIQIEWEVNRQTGGE